MFKIQKLEVIEGYYKLQLRPQRILKHEEVQAGYGVLEFQVVNLNQIILTQIFQSFISLLVCSSVNSFGLLDLVSVITI